MKKYNLEDFLDWCKKNYNCTHEEILDALKRFYNYRKKFPEVPLHMEDISLTKSESITEAIIQYINEKNYNNQLIIGNEDVLNDVNECHKHCLCGNKFIIVIKFLTDIQYQFDEIYFGKNVFHILRLSIENALSIYFDDFIGYENTDFKKMTLEEFELFLMVN